MMHRRDFLVSTAALPLAAKIPAAGRAKSVVILHLTGGPSQLDTFDPKPAAPADVRSPFRPIATRIPGVHLTDLLPNTAGILDRCALIRTLHHAAPPVHEYGWQLLNTGRVNGAEPAGQWIGDIAAAAVPGLTAINAGRADAGMALDVAAGIAPHSDFASFCRDLPARIELSPVFAAANMFPTVFGAATWDCHAAPGALACDLGDYRQSVAPLFDAVFPKLIMDLADRGLLDSTLVLAVGEFGRTPRRNGAGGRDHWAKCWSCILAGGGVRGGAVVGTSDAFAAEPKDRPVSVPEILATVFASLGLQYPAADPVRDLIHRDASVPA